jgi:GT2 family glycosyltransferase
MQRSFDENPTIGASFCRDIRIDEHGHWQSISPLLQVESGILSNWLERIAVGQRLQAPSMVVRRDVYERLGGFDRRLSFYGEDWEMWVRIAAHYPVWYEVRPLAAYRIRTNSLSGNSVRTGENGRDYRQAIEINKSHLPAERVVELSNRARENFALACLRRAHRLRKAGDRPGSMAQVREAIKSRRSMRVLAGTILLFAMWAGKTVGLTRFISPDD